MVLYAKKHSYITISILLGPIVIMTIAIMMKNGQVSPFAITASALIYLYLWLSRFKLELSTDTLSYRTLLAGTRTIRSNAIIGVGKVSTGLKNSYFRIAVHNRDGKPLVINGGVFNPMKLQEFMKRIEQLGDENQNKSSR